ncbi:MAG: hypothetical protein VKN56_08510 [Cyanobacteriota bacterium]|nr:hypothetical protein [Cyanobacteriota bacterium]
MAVARGGRGWGLFAGMGSRRAWLSADGCDDVAISGTLGGSHGAEVTSAEAGVDLLLAISVNTNDHRVKAGLIDASFVASHGW